MPAGQLILLTQEQCKSEENAENCVLECEDAAFFLTHSHRSSSLDTKPPNVPIAELSWVISIPQL